MSTLTIILLRALVVVALLVIAGGVYYDVYYKPAHAYGSVTGPSPPTQQGSLITPENEMGTTTTTTNGN